VPAYPQLQVASLFAGGIGMPFDNTDSLAIRPLFYAKNSKEKPDRFCRSMKLRCVF